MRAGGWTPVGLVPGGARCFDLVVIIPDPFGRPFLTEGLAFVRIPRRIWYVINLDNPSIFAMGSLD